jgi:hypothetical protein
MRVGLLVLVMLATAVQTASAEQRFAVLIGSNPGWSSDRPLKYAENDAEKLRDALVALGNFANDRVVILRDPDAAEVRATLRDLARTAKNSSEDTLVFFYYSGHADDTQMHLRGADPLTFKELQQTLRALPSTIKLGVIDACKSGAVTRKGGARVDEFVVDVDSPKLSGMVMLTSSGADELSQESRSLQGSVFTHHLVSALRGAADEDNDGNVTVSEAYHYAYTRTRADTATAGTPQRPAFRYELSGQGELVLAQLKSSKTAKVKVPKGDTKYVVLDKNEWRLVAEARAEKGREVELTLAPGTYKVKKVHADKLEVGQLVLAAGERAAVENIKYTDAPLSQGIVKGSVNDMSPEESREFRREQANGILAQGQAQAALSMYDALIREQQDDLVAWRGRARALVRIAEAYERVGDHMRERLALNDALQADPGLAEDPMFTIWYKRLGELDARAAATFEARQQIDNQVKRNPRTNKRFGIGFDLVSGRGAGVATFTAVFSRMIMPRIAVDAGGPGLDAGIVIAPFNGRWSPFIGAGAHISFAKLGLGDESSGQVTTGEEMHSYAEMYGRQVRAEIGAQFVSRGGFTTELGLALMSFENDDGTRGTSAMPILHFGWLW